MAYADIAGFLHDWSDEDCAGFLKKTDDAVADRLRDARKLVRKNNYRTWLFFVTTGKVSSSVRNDATQQVNKVSQKSRIEIIDGNRAMLLFRDYLDGVAPPIPSLDLEMECAAGIQVNGIAQRFDHTLNVESWVFSMRGHSIAEIYDRSGLRIFARNIRGFMGTKTAVNQGMVETLETEPERFFFYNNGITIVCDAAERKSARGRDYLRVENPQIINGQQTTRTLSSNSKLAGKASVLVKVIVVPRKNAKDGGAFEDLVSRIVAGTNWQNAIKQSDLMSNDRKQIDLERAFRKVGYFYLRKRQSKAETRKLVGKGQYRCITKEEIAQAVAGCDFDPTIIRSGREKLFSEQLYSTVFPNSDPDYYLPRYWLTKEVSWCSRGRPERGYAKWMVLNFVWSQVGTMLRGKQKPRVFRQICENQFDDGVVPLSHAIDLAFIEALRFFKEYRGAGDTALDVSAFFKSRKALHTQFGKYFATKASRSKFEGLLQKLDSAISNYDH